MKFFKKLFGCHLLETPPVDYTRLLNFVDTNSIQFYHSESLEQPGGLRFFSTRSVPTAHPHYVGELKIPIKISSIEGTKINFTYGGKGSYVALRGGWSEILVVLDERDKQQIYDMLAVDGCKRINICPLRFPYRGSIVVNNTFGYRFELTTEGATMEVKHPYREPSF